MLTRTKTPEEIDAMREGGKMLAQVLESLKSNLRPGITTYELSEIAKKELASLGGEPAFLGYQGFKDVLCVSVNDEVVHGIPSKQKVITSGDIVSCDFGVLHKGLITDAAFTKIVGQAKSEREVELVEITRQALKAGIKQIKDGATVGDIGFAVEKVLSRARLGVVRDYVGHGVGHALHEEPSIPNFGRKREGFRLQAGMTIAIEPMATLGGYRVWVDEDGWTVRTHDGSRAAHFEHTILVKEHGFEILTEL